MSNPKKLTEKQLKKYEIPVKKLYKQCEVEELGFETTAELPKWNGTLDQKEALEAIDFGFSMKTRGFNIFASGPSGSGKTSNIIRVVKNYAKKKDVAADICYLHNFDEPYEPVPLLLPPGKGSVFAKGMENFVKELKYETHKILNSPSVSRFRTEQRDIARRALNQSLQELMQEAQDRGLHIKVSDEGELIPATMYEGELVTEEDLANITEVSPEIIEIQKSLGDANSQLLELSLKIDKKQQKLEKKLKNAIEELEKSKLTPVVERLIEEVKQDIGYENHIIDTYFEGLKQRYFEIYNDFIPKEEAGGPSDSGLPPELEMLLSQVQEDIPAEFKINVLVDRSKEKNAPVIVEKAPTYSNLLGYLEYNDNNGALSTDHTLIRPGALHKANGGYLIIQANDVLTYPVAWFALKKALRHKEIRVEELREEGRPRITGTVKPKPVPLDVKIILVGNEEIYYLLQNHDEEFNRLFKVKADFSTTMKRNKSNLYQIACFIGQAAKEEKYYDFHVSAVSKIIEYISGITEDQNLLSNRTSTILDLMAESDLWAKKSRRKNKAVMAEDVEKAIIKRNARHSRIEKQILDEIANGTILIDTTNVVTGQINGMAVYDLGDHAFGIPVRITAITYAGTKGIFNVDREANLSGNIHDKGSLILTGFFSGRFAKNKPISFSASIAFEQSYSSIDGDSASSTELFALLSSLSELPIKQSIAVTGSVNQQGFVQAIGGVNEKIEGFFKVCKLKKLTGEQGVIIPKSNVKNLALPKEIIDAVKEGKFKVYAISTIDEGIEILTGVKAGKQKPDGSWEENTVNYLVNERLLELTEILENSPESEE